MPRHIINKTIVKYPLCSKYLLNCYGKLSTAFADVEAFDEDQEAYDEFLNNLKPRNPVTEQLELNYAVEELQESFLTMYGEPLEKSLIYNPK